MTRLAALVTLVVVLSTACAGSGAPERPDLLGAAPPVEGVAPAEAPVVGVVAHEGSGIVDAAEEAIAALASDGVAVARSLVVRAAEPGTSVGATVEAVDALFDLEPVLVIIGCDRDAASIAARRAAIEDVLAISPCATAPGLTDGAPTTFALAPTGARQGDRLARAAGARGFTNAITISDVDSADGFEMCDAFVQRFTADGGDVIAEIELGPSTDVGVLAEMNPAELVVACVDRPHASERLAAIRELGHRGAIFTGFQAMDRAGGTDRVTATANIPRDRPWAIASVTGAALEILGAAAPYADDLTGTALARVVTDVGVFDTGIGRIELEDRRNIAPLRLRAVGGQ